MLEAAAHISSRTIPEEVMQQVDCFEESRSGLCASRSVHATMHTRHQQNCSEKFAEKSPVPTDTKELPVMEPCHSDHADDSTTASDAEQVSGCCKPTNAVEEVDSESTTASEGEQESSCCTPAIGAAEHVSEAVAAPAAEASLAEQSVWQHASLPQLADEKIIFALAKLLKHVAQHSKPSGHKSGFLSVRLPSVSLGSFAARIRRFFQCCDECFVLCLVYIDRIIKLNPHFQVSDLACHRLLLVGCVVAAKFHDDEYASNDYFAKVGGIDVQELNALEVEFLQLLNWKLFVADAQYNWYLQSLRCIP